MARRKKEKAGVKEKRIKPELPGGFRDYAPEDAIARVKFLQTIRKTFEDFGFDPLETPAVERVEVLTGGERESGKIIFTVKGSEESAKKQADLALRFDLTVPLARFVAANPDVPKPFRRYQIGSVWRGESPQKGRYREFVQADADIVGASSLEADAEILALFSAALENLGLHNFRIKINSRKILDGLPAFAGFRKEKFFDALRIIDKRDKIGWERAEQELTDAFGTAAAKKIAAFVKDPQAGIDDPVVREGFSDLETIMSVARNLGVSASTCEVDYSVVRGLGYYTGFVFEIVLSGETLGAVAAGGRYDTLVKTFTGERIPAVGASLGVDRLWEVVGRNEKAEKRKTTARALLFNLSPALRGEYAALLRDLRRANVNTAFYLGDDRTFQAQLAYALKLGVGYVIIYGDMEKERGVYALKNLVTRTQRNVTRAELFTILKGGSPSRSSMDRTPDF